MLYCVFVMAQVTMVDEVQLNYIHRRVQIAGLIEQSNEIEETSAAVPRNAPANDQPHEPLSGPENSRFRSWAGGDRAH